MKTSTIKPEAPAWLLVDASGQSFGRIATHIAHFLRGKHKPSFSPHQLCGDHVVVVNASKLDVHPGKIRKGLYVKHTGYIGHLKTTPLKELLQKDPSDVIVRAVRGMLPKNKLRDQMMKRLHVFADDQHTFDAQKPQPVDL